MGPAQYGVPASAGWTLAFFVMVKCPEALGNVSPGRLKPGLHTEMISPLTIPPSRLKFSRLTQR